MKVLIDISHPAHVHFYRHIRTELINGGADVRVIARDKDVTLGLLDAFGIPYETVGRSGRGGWLAQVGALLERDAFIVRDGHRFGPDLVLTRNPSGVQAARMIGARGIFDTDDGRSVGVHYWAAAPFAHWVTAPDCLDEPLGRRSVRYPSYKALAYLHPDVFAPNPQVNVSIGLQVGEPYALLRLVAHDASHDRGAVGLSIEHSHRLIGLLEGDMRVFVSAEGQLDTSLKDRELRIPPETMHDVLAGARIVVGDSQSVIAEAAVLGTPAVRVNSYTGATPYLVELEEKYGLAFSFTPAAFDEAIALVSSLVAEASTGTEWSRRRDRMLEDKVNLTEWYIRFLTDLESTE